MSLSRSAGDIAVAIAYATGEGDFGRLDHLVVAIPEPATMGLVAVGGLMIRRRR